MRKEWTEKEFNRLWCFVNKTIGVAGATSWIEGVSGLDYPDAMAELKRKAARLKLS